MRSVDRSRRHATERILIVTDPLYQIPSVSLRRQVRPTRVMLVVESPDGHAVSYELDGRQVDIEIDMKYEQGSRSQRPFPGNDLFSGPYDDYPEDQITLKVQGAVRTMTDRHGPWLEIKGLDQFPELHASRPLASGDSDDSSDA